jgi:hypothetical protein
MPPAEQTMNALMNFLHAPNWDASRRVLDAHPELLNVGIDMIDMMLTDPATTAMAYRGRSDAETLLRNHRTVLARCKQVGVSRAFAELQRK